MMSMEPLLTLFASRCIEFEPMPLVGVDEVGDRLLLWLLLLLWCPTSWADGELLQYLMVLIADDSGEVVKPEADDMERDPIDELSCAIEWRNGFEVMIDECDRDMLPMLDRTEVGIEVT